MKIYKIKPEGAITPSPLTHRSQTGETAKSKDIHLGIDRHQKSWHVTTTRQGVIEKSANIPPAWDALEKMLRPYEGCRLHAVYEAGYFGYSLYRQLVSHGIECIVTPPSLIPRQYGNRVKTDRIDSTKLALLLSQQALKGITVPTEEEETHRTVLRRRRQLVEARTRVQLQILSELRFYSIPFPESKGTWSGTFVDNLHHLTFQNRWLKESFHRLLENYDHLTGQIATQTRLVIALSKLDRYRETVKLLKTIPGIGTLIAMEILLELLDVKRFPSGKHLAAYLGLTPSQYSSGEHVRMGRITGMGKGHLRAMLIEASWILIRKDPEMGEKYQMLKYRSGAKRAIVAIARKLTVRIRRVIIDQTPYVIRGTKQAA